MIGRIVGILAVLAAPSLVSAQTPAVPNEHAAEIAKTKVAAAMERRATRVRGEAVTPAVPAIPATRATPAVPNPDGGPATRAVPAIPATPAVPASPSRRPEHAGQGGRGRRP